MNYKLINLYNLENIDVIYYKGYYNFVGSTGEFVSDPINIVINENDSSLLKGYFLEDDYYIPAILVHNECLIINSENTLLCTRNGKNLDITLLSKEEAFDIFYKRRNELKNKGLEIFKNPYFDKFEDSLEAKEQTLIDFCFKVLDKLEETSKSDEEKKETLKKCILALNNPGFVLFSKAYDIIELTTKAMQPLRKKMGNNFYIDKVVESTLNKTEMYRALPFNKGLDSYVNYVYDYYVYINNKSYVKRYNYLNNF